MLKRVLLILVVIVALVNLFFTSTNTRRDIYLSELIERVNLKTMFDNVHDLEPVFSPMVKEDRKDNDQFDILTVYRNDQDHLISKVLILPDGIEEPFRMSVLVFNISATEDRFIEKHEKNPLPKKLNNHKLMKPCKGEVEIPILKQFGFQVTNITSITEEKSETYNYHNLGYCTKLNDLSDRYIEIDGKSSEKDKFKFEYNLQIMHLLYPEKYPTNPTMKAVTGWKYFKHFLIIVLFVVVVLGGNYLYFQRLKTQNFQKINNDIELQNGVGNNNNVSRERTSSDDIDEFLISDEEEDEEITTAPTDKRNKKKNKKVSYKNADGEEVKNLLNQ